MDREEQISKNLHVMERSTLSQARPQRKMRLVKREVSAIRRAVASLPKVAPVILPAKPSHIGKRLKGETDDQYFARAESMRKRPSPSLRAIPSLTFDANGASNSLSLGNRGFVGRGLLVSTGNPLTDVVANGVARPGSDPRWPDNFSLTKTTTIVQTSSRVCTTANSSAVPGGYTYVTAGALFGTNLVPGGLLTTMPMGVPDWSAFNSMPSLYASSDFLGRICGQVFDIQFNLQGIDHTVELNAFPLVPLNSSSLVAVPAGWPVDLNSGPTDLHCSWGARTWHLKSGANPVRLMTVPMDSRCLDFETLNVERGDFVSPANMAWTGWVFWINGLSVADVVRVTCTATWEITPLPLTANMYIYPSDSRPCDSRLMDVTSKRLSLLLDDGSNAFQWTSSTGAAHLAATVSHRGYMSSEQVFGPPSASTASFLYRRARLPESEKRIPVVDELKGDNSSQLPHVGPMASLARSLNAEREAEQLTGTTTPQGQSQCSSSTACPPNSYPSTPSTMPQLPKTQSFPSSATRPVPK